MASEAPLTPQEALRPFAAFALEARMGPEHRFTIYDPDGNEVAALTGSDFAAAFAVYSCGDPLCVDGMVASGLKVSKRYQESLAKAAAQWRPAYWLWGIVFFVLGIMAGAAHG